MPAQVSDSSHKSQTLSQKAQLCLEQATEIPGAPLYHMGNIAIFQSKSSFDLMQATINYLTCKAQIKLPFNDAEKVFLIELYESFWWGGYAKWMPEAAKLADHYVNGKGQPIDMNPTPYQKSIVVQDVIKALKLHIAELASQRKNFFTLSSDNIHFRQSKYFKPLMLINGSRNIATQGYVKSNGTVYADQKNLRLLYADNRFFLNANTTRPTNNSFHTWWSIDNRYDFEPFSTGNKISKISLGDGNILQLPDGLSEYMDSGLNIAKPFKYSAKWSEIW